jgi:hypothetical protein
MASSILQGDYLILLRKRECSLKDLALLLMVDGSVTLYFLYVTQLIRNTSFYRHKRGLQLFNYLVVLFHHSGSYNYSICIACDAYASSFSSINYLWIL